MKSLLAIPLAERGKEAALAALKAIWDIQDSPTHIDLVELRLDLIDDDTVLAPALAFCQQRQLGVIITYRATPGESTAQLKKRHAIIGRAIVAGVEFVDVDMTEGATAIGAVRRLIAEQGGRTRLIISHHDFLQTPSFKKLCTLFSSCQELGADVVKIATMARAPQDNLNMLNLLDFAQKKQKPLSAFCMGDGGRMSRIMAPALGAMISYVALNDAARSAPGQLTIAEVHLLANILQPETSKRETDKTASSSNPLPLENDGNNGRSNAAVYAVFGNPIRHSLSPLLHNTAFRRLGINGVYVPFCVQDIAVAVSAIRELGMKGVSVTLPFKSAVIPFLDRMDESALAIGAVNTIVNNNGELIGYNTDWSGAMAALTSLVNIAEKRIAILGAGGTARAICFGVKKYGAIPLIINRSAPRGEALAHEWGISFYTSKEWRQVEADILINTTPMGMNPLAAELPLPTEALSRFSVVMDIIYNPLETMLLREAKKAGAQTISGTEMFVQQGAQQIQLWTGKTVPLALLRSTVLAALTATEITAGTVNPKKERR